MVKLVKYRVIVKLVKVNYGRIWKRTSEAMRWVAWFMKQMQGCVTRCMGALGPYRVYSNRLMPSRPNWHWLRLRWCTCGWGRPHHSQTIGSARAAPVAAARPHPGSWAPRPSPFLTWIWWWTSPAWERQCGHASGELCSIYFHSISLLYRFLMAMAVAMAASRYKSSGGGHSPASIGLNGSLSLINIYICMYVVNTIYKHSRLRDLWWEFCISSDDLRINSK